MVPKASVTATDLIEKIDEAIAKAKALNWRIFDLTISPVKDIPEEQTAALKK